MAYPHYLIEVSMEQMSVSTAAVFGPTDAATGGNILPLFGSIILNVSYNPTGFGAGQFAPLCVPHKVHRVGVRLGANLADPIDLLFWKRLEGGATTWGSTALGNPTGVYFRVMVPTIAATGKAIYKNATGNYIVNPGEALCVGASTPDVMRARVNLLVSPVWEEGANVTTMSRTTAP